MLDVDRGPVRRFALDVAHGPAADGPLEWLVTNGLGGYASGVVAGPPARRYHGLLIAALPAPLGRTLVLDLLRTEVVRADEARRLEDEDIARADDERSCTLREFRLDSGLPVWHYATADLEIEKTVVMPHGQNTTIVSFRRLAGSGPARLRFRPFAHVRPHDAALGGAIPGPATLTRIDHEDSSTGVQIDVSPGLPQVRWMVIGSPAVWRLNDTEEIDLSYETELRRGYDHVGRLWSPGTVELDLPDDGPLGFVVSTELWDVLKPLRVAAAIEAARDRRRRLLHTAGTFGDHVAAELTLAADQFLVLPSGRAEEVARTRAAGDEPRTVIAGYHWFTDWGRDTMIGLEGLTLVTGRTREAGGILRTFGAHVRDGLIPNLFPEGQREGLYHTADATLWFFHAVDRYLSATADRAALDELLPRLTEIAVHHLAGTRFGIGADPDDGLMAQGAPGYQLTWMDAKVGDWVVTPRRGKAVEINALWYNALCLLAGWLEADGQTALANVCRTSAHRVYESFNARFWNASSGCLFDVVDGESGDDPSCRPNQIFAIALPHPVLDRARWRPVLEVVIRELLTPVGLRSLSPSDPQYQPRYFGDLRARDAAYHQGTVWAWLLGPFVDAYLKVEPTRRREARAFLEGLVPHLGDAGAGTVSEIFDAEPPYTPRGCIAQAWSVGELLRAWQLTN